MRLAAACIAAVLVACAVVASSDAAFPGKNGRIAWEVTECYDYPEPPVPDDWCANTIGIWTSDANGGDKRYLGPGSNPAWSPDGTKIAFEAGVGGFGHTEIWVMGFDGSNRHRVADGEDPAWSPDDRTIVFVGQHTYADVLPDPPRIQLSELDLFLVEDDGTGLRQLSTAPDPCRPEEALLHNNFCTDYDPAWSPDGSQIAFGRGQEGVDTKSGQIAVVDTDGGGYHAVTGWWGSGSAPNWSPDGSRLAFSGNFRIHTIGADGSGLLTMPPTFQDQYAPAWSPEGTEIVFRSMRWPGAESDLWIVDADGTNLRNFTNSPGLAEMNPDWAPAPLFPFSGFLPPLRSDGGLNEVRAGRAVPVKFGLGGDRGVEIVAAGSPTSAPIDCESRAALGASEKTQTAGETALQYDGTTDVYSYVWKTDKSWAGTCRTFTLRLSDGSVHRAAFRLS